MIARIFSVLLGVSIAAGCASKGDEYDSETHFACKTDADCAGAGEGLVCAGGTCRAPLSMKSGVPIGDCVEPTADELAAAGCPPVQPEMFDHCDEDRKLCRYGIDVSGGLAMQTMFSCNASEGSWGVG